MTGETECCFRILLGFEALFWQLREGIVHLLMKSVTAAWTSTQLFSLPASKKIPANLKVPEPSGRQFEFSFEGKQLLCFRRKKKISWLRHLDMQMKGFCQKLFLFSCYSRGRPEGGTLTGSRCLPECKAEQFMKLLSLLCVFIGEFSPSKWRVWKLLFIPLEIVCSFSHSICQRLGGQAPLWREGAQSWL